MMTAQEKVLALSTIAEEIQALDKDRIEHEERTKLSLDALTARLRKVMDEPLFLLTVVPEPKAKRAYTKRKKAVTIQLPVEADHDNSA